MRGLFENIWVSRCQQNLCRQTYKTANRPTGWDGSERHLDGYDALKWLRYCKRLNLFEVVK